MTKTSELHQKVLEAIQELIRSPADKHAALTYFEFITFTDLINEAYTYEFPYQSRTKPHPGGPT
ncbi:hypothetical protein ES703_67874 [subsurface metagenome]